MMKAHDQSNFHNLRQSCYCLLRTDIGVHYCIACVACAACAACVITVIVVGLCAFCLMFGTLRHPSPNLIIAPPYSHIHTSNVVWLFVVCCLTLLSLSHNTNTHGTPCVQLTRPNNSHTLSHSHIHTHTTHAHTHTRTYAHTHIHTHTHGYTGEGKVGGP